MPGNSRRLRTPPATTGPPLPPFGMRSRTGDTGPNPALWQRLKDMKVAHLVIETAFSDEERQLARISRHLCPAMLGQELAQLDGSVDVHITHIKPGEMDAVMSEIGRLGTPHRIHALQAGQVDACLDGARDLAEQVWQEAQSATIVVVTARREHL